jgi:hypothetical protein
MGSGMRDPGSGIRQSQIDSHDHNSLKSVQMPIEQSRT